jgi:two-component system LytT family response regulator
MPIRALIVDDEAPARELIATLIRDEPDLEVVGQCSNGRDAVAAIKRFAPDLVFLDVQMPLMDGFAVLAELRADRLPLVVFVTAYDQHALRAFEVHALDYLLKPFEYDRLRQAVRHARKQLAQGPSAAGKAHLVSLLEELHNQGQSWERLVVRDAGRILFLQANSVDWIEAEGNYVRLHIGKESHLLRETMNSTEARLASRKFLRVSRSTIVNLERVTEWQPLFHGDSIVILRDGTRLTVSRVYRETFDRLVSRLG